MVRIPTPIPKTARQVWTAIRSVSLLLILWRLFLLAVFATVIGALASAGPLGWLTAVAIFGALFTDWIQAFARDLWNGRFIRVSVG